ncbi:MULTISPECIES: hypothetical protein [Mycobacteriaceae]|uniref:VirB8 protein n=1 Tax=Mycolicibacterium novocastrense TaxID=59813 RepID=A0AAW5SUT5_MYCNV|nr:MULTISPECIES: hypothetical protein [Mycobacteriaceae]MCV7027347.1 hypothetical protein [Mycolicibacterium novocastrense]OBB71735.1 hypothetical protein A5759_21625 [Mycobacterium sp. 852014-52144_SCH5372336]GAT07133.1 VirB8 protein [Mycolicibacterium novocastrense]
MPSFRRRASVIDADRVTEPPQQDHERSAGADEALALAEEAEAEAAEAEAIAAAARARAKAIRLRRQAAEAKGSPAAEETVESADSKTTAGETPDVATDTEAEAAGDTDAASDDDAARDEAVGDEVAATEAAEMSKRRLRMPRIRWKIVAAVVAVLLILWFGAASGYMVWQHRQAQQVQQRTAEYVAAARQSVVTLMSLDFNKAKEDVQRIIDNSTGEFKQDFQDQAEDFAKVAQESKVVTEVTVNVAAVKSMTDTGATAIVSATSRVTNSAGANQEPRAWRLLVDLVREDDQIKMSKVEFVP